VACMLQVYTVHVVFLHEHLQIYLRYGAWSDYLIASNLIQTMRGVLYGGKQWVWHMPIE
jgi:hypothetical protein